MQIIISKCLLETYCGFYQHVNIKIISCLSSLLEKWGKVGRKYSVLLFLFRLLKWLGDSCLLWGWSGFISCVCRRWCVLSVPNEYTLYINRARMNAHMLAHPCSFEGHIFPLIALIYTDIHCFRVHPCPFVLALSSPAIYWRFSDEGAVVIYCGALCKKDLFRFLALCA